MRQVYDYEQLIFIKGKTADFCPTSIWNHFRLATPGDVLDGTHTEYFYTFEDFLKAVQEDKIWNAETWNSWIMKRPIIRIRCGLDSYYITKRNFTEVYLFHRYRDASNETIVTLMRNMKADDFAEYLRDRGINLST